MEIAGVTQLPVDDLAARLSAGARLIDVREDHEWAMEHIPGAELMPMSRLQEWAPELDPGGDYIFQCRSGQRSQQVAAALAPHGFRVQNLAGGILAWADAQR